MYLFIAYIITIASIIAGISIWYKNDIGLGFASGLTTGAFGALQIKPQDQPDKVKHSLPKSEDHQK